MDALRLGLQLRALRIRRRWRQLDVALRAGVSRGTISNIERGLTPLPRTMLPTLVRYLKINRDEILDLITDETRQKFLAVFKEARAASRKNGKSSNSRRPRARS